MTSRDLNPNDLEFFELLVGSFRRVVGRDLLEKNRGPEWLYGDAPFAVVAHNSEAEPLFVYANATAQRRFGYSWSEFTRLKAKLATGQVKSCEQAQLLDAIDRKGFVTNYRGLQVMKSGGRFRTEDATVWQLKDRHGVSQGQAAMFSKWVEA